MKRFYISVLLLLITIAVSAQVTIKTGNGKMVEINFNGEQVEVVVVNDSIILRPKKNVAVEKCDSVVPIGPTENVSELEEAKSEQADTTNLATSTSGQMNLTANSNQSIIAELANSLAEELSPEYAEFNREHEGTHPASEEELAKNIAKELVGEDVVKTADFLTTIFGYLVGRDSTFVPSYEQRKPKKFVRAYDIIELEGHLGKNISNISDVAASQINYDDYGDDTADEQKYGGGVKFSRVNISGSVDSDGQWHQNPLGFAWSWGFLATYSYEKEKGSYFNGFGKVGMQIGNDIAIGVDGLLGCGVIPYNTFYTNGINHSVLNKSAFCLKYGVQLWGSLNFSKDTYTAVYGRYLRSVKPSSSLDQLNRDWAMVIDDFDPSDWTVGLAVGYKFGAPEKLSTDKRLKASFSTGYQLTRQKGIIIAGELERITQVSRSIDASYGLSVEQLFDQNNDKQRYASVLASLGFQVRQPDKKWFWGAKLYGGVGDNCVTVIAKKRDLQVESFSKKLSAIAALQLNTGLKIGKCSYVSAACRVGCHLGAKIENDGLDDVDYKNLSDIDASMRLSYYLIF